MGHKACRSLGQPITAKNLVQNRSKKGNIKEIFDYVTPPDGG
jgi:hypothetical protein